MRRSTCLAAAAAMALAGSNSATFAADATPLFWQGGSGNLTDPNYTDGVTPNQPPTSVDTLYIGAAGTASNTSGDQSVGRLIIGHNQATNPGAGTVSITGGSVSTTDGASGNSNAGVIIGNDADGTLTIDAATLTVNQLVTVGLGSSGSVSGTLDITNGGTATISAGNMNVGAGVAGHVNVNGSLNINGSGADMVIGATAASSYDQTGGTANVKDTVFVRAGGSTLDVSSGSLNAAAFSVADNGSAADVTATFSGDSITTVTNNFTVGQASTSNATMTISDTSQVNIGVNFNLGTGTSSGATLNMTGGTLSVDRQFLISTGGSNAATGVVVNHSGGDLILTGTNPPATNHGENFVLADTGGEATYHLSGTGTITTSTMGSGVIGRRGDASMDQTGGSASFGNGLFIGEDQAAANATAFGNSGIYTISGGTLSASPYLNVFDGLTQLTNIGLGIGTGGDGRLNVMGSDATINITGDFHAASTSDGSGTLAYLLQSGESLTEIMVSGAATFDAGSTLAFSLDGNTPGQSVYDLLTATSITDAGLTFDNSGAPGWSYQIVSGGNGQVLQAVLVPEPGALGLLAAASLLGLRQRRHA